MDKLTLAHEWYRFAAMDLSSAKYLLNMKPSPVEIICYHCQQSAEKFLKGFLVLHDINPPKIHDLDELCKLCIEIEIEFQDIIDQCSDLTAYGIQPRYPAEINLEEQDLQQALKSAETIRDFILPT